MGLRIKTITGVEFEVYGQVKYNPDTNIYYCNGSSYPAEIVEEEL